MSADGSSEEFFSTLSRIRDQDPRSGGLPLNFDKSIDSGKILVQFYEPDAYSCRSNYYYNSRQNVLYKKQVLNGNKAVWKSVITI